MKELLQINTMLDGDLNKFQLQADYFAYLAKDHPNIIGRCFAVKTNQNMPFRIIIHRLFRTMISEPEKNAINIKLYFKITNFLNIDALPALFKDMSVSNIFQMHQYPIIRYIIKENFIYFQIAIEKNSSLLVRETLQIYDHVTMISNGIYKIIVDTFLQTKNYTLVLECLLFEYQFAYTNEEYLLSKFIISLINLIDKRSLYLMGFLLQDPSIILGTLDYILSIHSPRLVPVLFSCSSFFLQQPSLEIGSKFIDNCFSMIENSTFSNIAAENDKVKTSYLKLLLQHSGFIMLAAKSNNGIINEEKSINDWKLRLNKCKFADHECRKMITNQFQSIALNNSHQFFKPFLSNESDLQPFNPVPK